MTKRITDYPKSFFNHRLVIFSWGWDLKTPHGWFTWSRVTGLYWSPDATPYHPDAKMIWARRWREKGA